MWAVRVCRLQVRSPAGSVQACAASAQPQAATWAAGWLLVASSAPLQAAQVRCPGRCVLRVGEVLGSAHQRSQVWRMQRAAVNLYGCWRLPAAVWRRLWTGSAAQAQRPPCSGPAVADTLAPLMRQTESRLLHQRPPQLLQVVQGGLSCLPCQLQPWWQPCRPGPGAGTGP